MTGKEMMAFAQSLQTAAVEHRRFLHQNAEIGFVLPKTKAFVWEKLTEMGYAPQDCGKAGVIACVGRERKGKKAFLLRADMDGLPIKEQTALPFACRSGNMHACGHDMHTSMLLCAAAVLKRFEKDLKGEVKLLFQPAEEILQGAKDVIDAGVLQSPDVGGALMMHVMTGVPMKTGCVVLPTAGIGAPSADHFTIVVRGKSCHGSAPQNGVDASVIAAHILLATQTIVAREISAMNPAVLTVGKILSGDAGNVISDRTELAGTIRAFDENARDFIKKRLTEVASGIARAFRGKAKTVFTSGCPSLVNDGEICRIASGALKEILDEKSVILSSDLAGGGVEKRSGGSEDFAYISRKVPSLMLAIGAGDSEKGFSYPLHHPKTTFDENVLCLGGGAMAYVAARWLES